MSEEDYNRRENTYRKFKQQKLQEDPTWTLGKQKRAHANDIQTTPRGPLGNERCRAARMEPAYGTGRLGWMSCGGA